MERVKKGERHRVGSSSESQEQLYMIMDRHRGKFKIFFDKTSVTSGPGRKALGGSG